MLRYTLITVATVLRSSSKSASATQRFRMNLFRIRDRWCSSAIQRPLTNSSSVQLDSPLVKKASNQKMSSEVPMVMFSASSSLHNNHLTSQGKRFAIKLLVGLLFSILFAMHLKLDLLALKNSSLQRTLTYALSNSRLSTMLGVAW
jgi:hypothetical protein